MKKAFLFLLSLFAFIGVQAQDSPYTGSEVGEGEFYLYNVGTGLWIQNIDANNRRSDDNWNTGAGMGTAGFDFVLTAVDDGYNLDPKENPGKLGWGYGDGGILYLDGNIGGNTHWDFTPVDGVSNGYKIYAESTADEEVVKHYLGVEAVDGKFFLINNATENDVWQLVTKAERLEKMQDIASADEPYDLSALMGDWNFATNNQRRSQWTEVQDGGNNDGFPRARRWNSSHLVWNTNYYSWTQTIEGVPDGLYQFSVQGMYRDGNRNQVGAKAANGETNLIAKYFIGGSEGSLMSILAEARESKGDGFETAIENTDPQLYAPDGANDWTIVWALHPETYWNEPIKANVRGGSVELGVRKTSNIGGDWIAMNEFKLEYVGPVDPELDKVALQNAVAAAEAFDGVTSDALASQLAEALENAQDLLESTTATYEDYANQADNLLQVLSAAQAVDVSVLKATAALAKNEGIDTSVADDLVANATEAGPISDALFDLRAARKVKAQSMPDVYTGSEPAEGKVYIYNLGTGLFLGTGASYNTHCAVDQVGVEIELIQDGEGFKMKTNRGGGWLAKGNRETSAYIDTPTQQVWHFIKVSDGVYNISFDGTATNLLGYNPRSINDEGGRYWSSIGIKREDGNDPMNQWKIITAAEREALLAEASKENPVDVSYLIPAASLNKQDNFPWVDEGDAHHAKVDNFENWGFEFWNNSSFKFSQTVENLPAGLYEISVQAFWREGDGANQVAIVNEDGALNQKAYLFANDAQELLPNIASYLDFVPGVGGDATSKKGIFPNWVNEALEYMETGAYWATVKVVVEEDGKLTLGVGCDEKAAFGDWTVIDNFRLTYLGNDANDMAYERALEAIEDGANYRVFTEVDGEKYYLTANGVLDNQLQKAGVFTFKKVAGGQYEYGFQLTSPLENRFTNPYSTAESWLTNGRITITGGSRNDWEAQVFFKNAEGKYAVRGTNASYKGETSGWSWIGNSYWTVNEGPLAEYSFDQNYVWQLEEAEADNRQEILAEVRPVVESWGKMLQDIDGLVTDASMYYANSKANESIGLPGLLDGDYGTYFHTMWGNSGVTEPHYLEATLPDAADKFYYYFVKRDPVNNGNVNNRPIHIAISGSNDGETFTPITEVDDMPLTLPPVNYMSELITADQAYKIIRFTVLDTNNHATDNNGNKFFTFSEFYILPSNELTDAATALLATDYTDIPLDAEGYLEQVAEMDAILKGYFKDVNLNLVLDGETLATETTNILIGKEAPAAPASFYTNEDVVSAFGGLVYFTRDVDEIGEETTDVNYTAESAISESFEDAKWFNMTIRGNWWVAMDETEPYYPKQEGADLTAEASQWAFGLVEGGTSPQIVVWNRAAGPDMSLLNTGELDSNGKPLVAMREGQTAWDYAPNGDGFVIHQVGTGDNQWVNQNGGGGGPFSIWDSGSAKGDPGSVLRIYPVEVEEETLEIALDVDRVVGQGYTADVATVDFAEALEFLGVEEVTTDMLYFVNPDGTEMDYATYSVSPQADFTYDGWCDADGAAAQWGATTAICVKFFQAIPDGAYEICDMNGADEVGKTYTVKWALKANGKSVVYSINVTFIEAPVFDLTFDDLEIAATEELDVKSELGAGYEGLTATVDIDNILATLEVESLADVTIAAVQPDGSLDLSYKLGTTDGWRDADGAWKGWANSNVVGLDNCPYFYVKANFEGEPQLNEIGGYPGHTDEPATFTAPYVFVVNGTAKAYLLNVNLIYEEAVEGISYEGEVDVTQSHPNMGVIGETTEEQTVTVTPAGDGLVTVTFSGFAMPMAALGSFDEFTIPNVSMTTNDDGSITYFAEGFQIPTSSTGTMVMNYNGTLEGSQESESAAPTFTVTLVNATTVVAVFNPNALEPTPEPVEFSGMIKQILSHPQTGVQGQATGDQTVTIEPAEDGKVNITYSGFTMPVTGAVLPEFTVEGVEVTENEDGSISYALPEDAEAEVVIDRGTGTVTYKVALEGTQADAEATPVLKLTLENSVVDTVWFGADEKTIDKAIATGINGVNALGTEGTIFDLSGRKVEKIQRGGIYIVNGKKVSVK